MTAAVGRQKSWPPGGVKVIKSFVHFTSLGNGDDEDGDRVIVYGVDHAQVATR